MNDQLRYPIGPFAVDPEPTADKRRRWIDAIRSLPGHLRRAVDGLTVAQLDTPYRPGGWTVRQLVHHVADSHMNANIRFRLALTEQSPRIKTYDQSAWAELTDAQDPVDVSLELLDALHRRWTSLLDRLGEDAYLRTLDHPDLGTITLDTLLQLYAWHGAHHVAHVTALREREGWVPQRSRDSAR